jgi:ABC-type transport system substrate-binding protein
VETHSFVALAPFAPRFPFETWIMPKHIFETVADPVTFEFNPFVGTGPYKLESYTAGKEIVMAKFDDYWGGWKDKPHFDKVVISIVPEAVTQQQMLEGGQVDLAAVIPLENVKQFKTNPKYTVWEEPTVENYLGLLNSLNLGNPVLRIQVNDTELLILETSHVSLAVIQQLARAVYLGFFLCFFF